MMNISADLYKVFCQVGLYRSFSKAAKVLGVSQSAISQNIKQLEKNLGVQLFVRTTKAVDFTRQGQVLFEATVRAFSLLDDTVEALTMQEHLEATKLRLAVPDTICSKYLLPYFREWQNLYPERMIQLVNRPSLQCLDLIREGGFDLAVVTLSSELYEDVQLEIIELMDLHDILVGGPAYKGKVFHSMQELMQEPLVLLESSAMTRRHFERLQAGKPVLPTIEAGSVDVVVKFLEMDMGVSLISKEYIQEELNEGTLVELDTTLRFPERKIGIVRSRLHPLKANAAKFIDLLVNP